MTNREEAFNNIEWTEEFYGQNVNYGMPTYYPKLSPG